jgi:hypothetical protein
MEEDGLGVALQIVGAKRRDASFPRGRADEGQLLYARGMALALTGRGRDGPTWPPTQRGDSTGYDAVGMNNLLKRYGLLVGLGSIGPSGARSYVQRNQEQGDGQEQ